MRKYSSLAKRSLSMFLSVLMVFSMMNFGTWLGVAAGEKVPVSKTEGEIVSENYVLSDAQKALIGSGLLVGKTYSYVKPDAEDNLVSVDADNKSIKAETYVTEGTVVETSESVGYTWVPVSADIVVNGATMETVKLTDGKGTYTYDGAAFSVDVKYELKLSIDAATQSALLNAPAALKQGIENLEAVFGTDDKLGLIAIALQTSEFQQLINDGGINTPMGTVGFADAELAAAKALDAQVKANNGSLNLSVLANNYRTANGKVVYLVANSASVKAELEATIEAVECLAECGLFDGTVTKLFGGLMPEYATLFAACDALGASLNEWLSVAKTALEGWSDEAVNGCVRDDLNDVEKIALDTLVSALGDDLKSVDTIKNPLVADTSVIRFNMKMHNVTIKVVFNKVDANNTVSQYDVKSTTIAIVDGATDAEVRDAINSNPIFDEAIAEWTAAGVYNEDGYKFISDDAPLGNITEDITVVYQYTPNEYTVKFDVADGVYFEGAKTMVLPYGYKLQLPKSPLAEKVYDYFTDGAYVAEGTVVTVVGNASFTVKDGKPYVGQTLNQIIADNYLEEGDKATAILTSGALVVGSEMINVRYPDASFVKLTGDTLTASNYDASYNNLVWTPDTYTLVNGATRTEYKFNGVNTVTITGTDYERVEVTYKLVLDKTDAEVLDIVNLPGILAAEAIAQKTALDRISAPTYLDNMGMLNTSMFGGIKGFIAGATNLNPDPAKNEELKAYFTSVIDSIIAECLGVDGSLKIYGYLNNYSDPFNGGLVYYYHNSQAIIDEIALLSEYLTQMLADDEKVQALTALLNTFGYGQYVDKLTSLETAMADVKGALKAPNATIDLTSPNLGKLCTALTSTGATPDWDALPASLALTSDAFVIDADNKKTITVTVQFGSGRTQTVFSETFFVDTVISAGKIGEIVAAVETASASVNDYFYTTNFSADALNALAGKTAAEFAKTDLAFVWTVKDFTVSVEGAADQIVNVENATITLPASDNFKYRYEYVIGSDVVVIRGTDGQYTFTADQIANLFTDGKYTVKLNKIDESREKLIKLVNTLNAAANKGTFEFVLVENNGEMSIVLKLNSISGSIMNDAMGVATTLATSGLYNYYGLDNNDFYYVDANGFTKISLQAAFDAVMNSGAGTDMILSTINANGSINQMNLAGTIVSDNTGVSFGGKLAETTMQIGNSSSDCVSLPFYVTIGSSNKVLTELRSAIAGKVGNYVNGNLSGVAANVNLTLPQKAYEAYLAVLLVTNEVNFSNINEVNAAVAIGFIKDFIDPALSGDVTLATLSNTLDKFGYDIDLSKYESLFSAFCDFYNGCTFTYNEKTGTVAGNVPISKILDKMDLGDLKAMIAEYDTGIDFVANLTVENLGTDFDALYIDVKADGFVNKAGLTKDIASKLTTVAGGSVIVLLDDVDADLTFKSTAILNLNGHTVNGDVNCNGKVIIVDTPADTSKVGTVNGNVKGNAYIVGGKFSSDVSAFVKDSYYQNANGVVLNKYFDLYKDVNGDFTVEINANLLNPDFMPDFKAVAVDVATELIFNEFTVNSLYVDGNKVYDITIEDLVNLITTSNKVDAAIDELVEMFDIGELATLIDTIIDDATDFESIKNAIENDTPIIKYPVVTGSWDLDIVHETNGNYLTANIASDNKQDRYFNVVVVGSDSDKQAIADMYADLADTVTVDIDVAANDGFSNTDNKNFVVDMNGSGNVVFDYSDFDHTLLINILIADGLGAPANADLVAGINKYFATGNFASLKMAFDNLTIAQVITAVENLERGDSIEAMIEDLGLTGYETAEIERIEKLYDPVLKVIGAVARKLDIDRGSRKLGSFLIGDNTYGVSKSDITKNFLRDLFRGYSVTMNVELIEASISLKLFGATVVPAPEFVDGNGKPEFADHEKVAGVTVDYANMLIIVDAHHDGITVDEFKSIITLNAINADAVEMTFTVKDNASIIRNGSTLKAVATSNSTTETATVEYTIIILGDVNGNGRNEAGDAALISANTVNLNTFDALQTYAADINANGRCDIGDASIVARKYTDWVNYVLEKNA